MGKASPGITAFNAGEWSPWLEGRIDIEGYGASCFKKQNMLATIQGPALRRAGTKHIQAVKNGANDTFLMPFVRSRSIAYVIEFGDQYCRFYFNRAPVLTGTTVAISGVTQANPGVVTATGHGYSNGDHVFITGVVGMTEINSRWFTVANATTNTFELTGITGNNIDTSGYTAYSSGGECDVPYEISSPFTAAQLYDSDGFPQLDWAQDADVIYITHRSGTIQPRKLSRTSSTSWAFSTVDPDDGPYDAVNSAATTMYIGAATGTGVTITASDSVFTADHVGALIRIDQEILTTTDPWKQDTAYTSGDDVRSEGKEYGAANSATSGTTIPSHTSGTVSDGGVNWEYQSAGYGVARITAQSGTTATVDVLTQFPTTLVGSGNASTIWQFGAFSDANGYPETASIFKERLCYGQSNRIHMSVADNFDSFSPDAFGEVEATSAITIPLRGSQTNEITGFAAGTDLLVLTEGQEFRASKITTSEAFGPNNVETTEETTYGSKPTRAIRVGEVALHVNASGKKFREVVFDFSVERLVSRDLALRSEHLTRKPLVQVVRQEDPYEIIWGVRQDGLLLDFTYDRTQSVRGWSRQPLGGADVKVKCAAVIPSPDGGYDDVWMITERTVNGQTVKYVERKGEEVEEDTAQEDVCYYDSALTYDGSAVTAIRVFDHL